MSLFARRPPVFVKDLVDECRDRTQFRLHPRRIAMDRRYRSGNRLPHHTSVHAKLGSNTGDRADTELVLLTELLKQFHSGFPIHFEPPG
jgi:hypothetical protein